MRTVRAHLRSAQRPARGRGLHPSLLSVTPATTATKEQFPATSEVYWSPKEKVDFYSFDADYLRRLQERDSETETHFAGYFGKRLQVKLRGRGFATPTVEDISQDTFLRVLTNVRNGAVVHPERFGAYVSSVCDNVIREQYRSHKRNQHMDVELIDPPDARTNLEASLLRKEERKIVSEILDEMPPKKRNILRAVLFDQLDRDELCARFNVNGDYLRVLLFRAREDFTALCKAKGLGI